MKIGFIGGGNMATAIIQGIVSSQLMPADNIWVSTKTNHCKELESLYHIHAAKSNLELATQVDFIVLAVKPHIVPIVLKEITPILEQKRVVLISIAAGLSLENLQNLTLTLKEEPIIRIMPNMNVGIGQGVSAICSNSQVTEAEEEQVINLFKTVGSTYLIPEKDFRIFTAIAGCSPAYTYLYIDSLARAGVKHGLAKDVATQIAAEAVLGSANMITKSNDSPWDLIDRVCSPGGTTIEGLLTLQEDKFTSAIVRALDATIEKDQQMELDN